jgi:lysyl-tRNA synthetase class 2
VGSPRRLVVLERHPLGPRVHILGVRVHEWHLGVGILALLVGCLLTDLLDRGPVVYLLTAVGVWAISKDWRDITPARRDTAAWRLGLHRPPRPLAATSRAWMPSVAALVTFIVGLANLVSTLTPDFGWRGHLLRRALPFQAAPIFHALALPLSALLLLASFYLYRKRRRAYELTFAVLVALGLVNLLKGLDFEEAFLSWLAAGLLWWGRAAFSAQPSSLRPRPSWFKAVGVFVAATLVSALAVAVAGAGDSAMTVLRELGDLMLWQRGPVALKDDFRFLPFAVGLLSLAGLVSAMWLLLRPFRPQPRLPDVAARALAETLVKAHGQDTLAFFKLRRDKHYLFDASGSAFLGYRIENGALIVSGDPVGDAAALPTLIQEALRLAATHGLAFGAIGASETALELYRQAGLKSVYVGDEAIVDVTDFSLEGRPIRKVRQSVTRLEKAGYSAVLVDYARLSERELRELEEVSALWLGGVEERGFSMAMDSLRGAYHSDSAVIVARDAAGVIGGFLHFVPSYGRPAYSLSFMRRAPETPNGLMEFLVVQAIVGFKARGVSELSLNFAGFSRFLRAPEGRREALLGRLVRWGDRFFQLESLYRFNAKFFPRWEPRYLVYESVGRLPRLALAVLWLEGQLGRPPRLRGDRGEAGKE